MDTILDIVSVPEIAYVHIFVHVIIIFNCRLLVEEMIKWPLQQSLKLEMIRVGCSNVLFFLSYWGQLLNQITGFNLKLTSREMIQASCISRG